MNISFTSLTPLTALAFGILILMFPKIVNYLIAAYLIITGLVGLGFIK
jgi:hypothetical protein